MLVVPVRESTWLLVARVAENPKIVNLMEKTEFVDKVRSRKTPSMVSTSFSVMISVRAKTQHIRDRLHASSGGGGVGVAYTHTPSSKGMVTAERCLKRFGDNKG